MSSNGKKKKDWDEHKELVMIEIEASYGDNKPCIEEFINDIRSGRFASLGVIGVDEKNRVIFK